MDQFYTLFSILMITSVTMTISSYNPIHSVFWLVIVFLESAIFLISLSYEFLGLMMIIIYVGAIAILFLFVIMMLDIFQMGVFLSVTNIIPVLTLLSTQGILLGYSASYQWGTPSVESWFFNQRPHVLHMGQLLYNDMGVFFLMISLILLIAMVGAIVLTLEVVSLTKSQVLAQQHHRNNSWT